MQFEVKLTLSNEIFYCGSQHVVLVWFIMPFGKKTKEKLSKSQRI